MPEFRVVHVKIGKYTHGNTIAFPNGAVLVADNYEAVRDNVYRKNRGRVAYGTGLPASDIDQIMEYHERSYLHFTNNNIWYDSDGLGTYVILSDATLNPDATTLMRELEFSGNMYFTTDEGIMLFDALGSAPLGAGEPRGLDVDLMLGTGTWLLNNNAVAYRHVWTYTDANNNKTTGSPSERTQISTAAGPNSVLQRISIPDGVTVNHKLEVYRSSQVALAVTPPEDFQLCYQVNPTAEEIAAGTLLFEDIMPDGFKGAFLYTNTTQEGLAQANEQPPLCKAMDKYRGYVFFADVTGLARLYSALIATVNITAGASTLTLDDDTNTLTMGCVTEVVGKTVIGTANIDGLVEIQTNIAHDWFAGEYVNVYGVLGTVEANGTWEIFAVTAADKFTLADSAYVNAWEAGAGQGVDQYVDYGATPRFIKYTTGTAAQNIDNTARSIIKTINLATGNSWWYAYYTSSVTDPPGKFVITGRVNDNVQFHLIADSTATGSSFSPAIPTAGTTYISNSSAYRNGLMYSKEQQAEHVPLVNILYAGSQNDPILRIIGLKDSLIIIKQNDGIYRLTGTSPSSFLLTELDGTCKCLQKESVAKGDNAVFMMSNQGRVKISDSGVEVIGRDNEYQDLKPTRNANFATTGFGWYYPTEKNYYLSTMNDENSTTFDTVSVYNTFTLAWTDRAYGVYTNDTQIRCAKVIDDICYYAPLTGSGLLRERKSFTAIDMSSPDVAVTIGAIDLLTNEITITVPVVIPKGSLLTQGAFSIRIITIIDTTHFIVVDAIPFAVGAAVILPGIVSRLKYHQCHCSLPDIEKNFQELSLLFDDEETDIENIDVSVYTDQMKLESPMASMGGSGVLWGTPDWGEYWLANNVTDKWRTLFPAEYSKGSHCYIEIEHSNAQEQIGICGYTVKYEPTGYKFGRE